MNKRWVWGLMLCAILGYLVYAGAVHSEDALAKDVLRLHILANSDTQEDQRIKLCVRDSVLEYIEQNAGSAKSKQEVTAWVQANLPGIEEVASRIVSEQGADYGASAEIGTFSFPEKTYGPKTYPAGMYDALRVKLGAAQGHNWWCVIFPPLCLADLGISPDAVGTAAAPAATTQAESSKQPETALKATVTQQTKKTPQATESPKATETLSPTASPRPDGTAEVIGGTGSYGYKSGILLESLIMQWLFN